MDRKLLNDYLYPNTPDDILKEVNVILDDMGFGVNNSKITASFTSAMALFKGELSGYKACNTEYHDLHHTLAAFLSMARFIHGAFLNNHDFTESETYLGLISALYHDVGYIQKDDDIEGTGAKYTIDHVQRSMDFVKNHQKALGLSETEARDSQYIIHSTDMSIDPNKIPYPSSKVEFLGKMLAASDILSQMADRAYLEKLLFLYYELREANIGDYKSEVDLLRRTIAFYESTGQQRIELVEHADRFLVSHFSKRLNINKNLYLEGIRKNLTYLNQILADTYDDPLSQLRRNNISEQIRSRH